MQKYNNQRVFPCIFEQKTISEQIDLILAHCVLQDTSFTDFNIDGAVFSILDIQKFLCLCKLDILK